MIFAAGLGTNVGADGVAGVGVTDQARGVAMDSISAVPDLDLLYAAWREEEGASDPALDARETGRLFDELDAREFEEEP